MGGEGARWCVVTGGRGFAARHLVEMLVRSGEWLVRIADLAQSLSLDPLEEEGDVGRALRSGRAAYVSADLRNKAQVVAAFEGAEVVFHMAAPDSSINSYQLHYSVNVQGTKNVIDACIECKVKRLIYTSSPSVVFDGVNGIYYGGEAMPYPKKFNDSYSETKAEGEKLVMNANGRCGLLTCCIRPSSIFGPGDRLLVPSLVNAARAGKSKFIIGDGDNVYDFTYVENVAYGHICAERTLAAGGVGADRAAGQAYFITNMEPIKFWEFVSLILEGLGYERPRIKIPVSVMMPIAHLVELTYKTFSRYGMPVPQLTPSRIRLLSCNRTFSCAKAEDQLGYKPIVPLKDALKKTIDSYSDLRSEHHVVKSKPSSSLGSGKIASTLLLKDKKHTLTVLLCLVVFYYYSFGCGYTFFTAMAKLLSLAAMFLFIHSLLPAKMMGFKIEKMSPSVFHLSEGSSRRLAGSITYYWNSAAGIARSICKGKDWTLFFKVAGFLMALNFLGAMSLHTIYVLGVPLIFIAAFVYEKMVG
ncbi:putative 3beta-hydroxysteroid-dehydrogenase/decarboxylase isoform 1 [Iris pallida]|uniref:3beta-hydroxysteroid-dehydrogenase/decarboxylase isoform 1 n=1 Tax=Iris pallida TaxID=29817 RepID=A0AAX6ENL2_IRIPA|nr:putative 3beta-hydroxysteroid-dehydrogenase/decarboxylase isoform 1 [Iris pallida]